MSYLTGLLENEDLYVGTEWGKPKEQLGPQKQEKGDRRGDVLLAGI